MELLKDRTNIQGNYGLDILSIQLGRDCHLALAKFRYFKTKFQKLISEDQLTLKKSLIKSKDTLKLRALVKYKLVHESKNFFYFHNEEKLYKKMILENSSRISKIQKEYVHINAFNYSINENYTELELRALSWSLLALHAPTDISQEKLASYLNISRQSVTANLGKQEFHKNKQRSIKIGEIDGSQKRVIRNLFNEIKDKKKDESKLIIKKNEKTQKVEIFVILTNQYIKKENLKISIKRTKKGVIERSSKSSLIELIKKGYNPSGIHPSSKLKNENIKDSALTISFKQWEKNKISNCRLLNVGSNKKKKVLWKYEFYNQLPSNVENAMNKIKGFMYLEEQRRSSDKKISNIVGKDNNIFQLPIRKKQLFKKAA